MLEFSFVRTSIKDYKCFVEICIKRKKYKYCGIFVDLLGNQKGSIVDVLCKELIPAIPLITERTVLYCIPEETPVFEMETGEYTIKEEIKKLTESNKIERLEKRGTFILEPLKNFIMKNGDKLIFVIAQNPVWDIKLGLRALEAKDIPLHIVRLPQKEELRDKIASKREENIKVYDGDNVREFCCAEIKAALGIRNRKIKFDFNNAKLLERFEENYKSLITDESNFFIEISGEETEKKFYVTLKMTSDSASVLVYEEGKEIVNKKIKDIQEDPLLEKRIEQFAAEHSKVWERLFNKFRKNFDSEDYKFDCDRCGEARVGFKCFDCGKLNPAFSDFSNIIEKYKPKYILLYPTSGSQLKQEFITSNGSYTISGVNIEFSPGFWRISTQVAIKTTSLKTQKELTENELREIGLDSGNVYKIMIGDECIIVIDTH